MGTYSLQSTSELLNIPKDTLRYYDKLGLVCPSRSENNYRHYNKQDIIDLKCIEIMKFADFSLSEIKQFFEYSRSNPNETECKKMRTLFEDKKENYLQKIKSYKKMITLVDELLLTDKTKNSNNTTTAEGLISNIFSDISNNNKNN